MPCHLMCTTMRTLLAIASIGGGGDGDGATVCISVCWCLRLYVCVFVQFLVMASQKKIKPIK